MINAVPATCAITEEYWRCDRGGWGGAQGSGLETYAPTFSRWLAGQGLNARPDLCDPFPLGPRAIWFGRVI